MSEAVLGVSVVQAGSVAFDTAATLDKFEHFAAQAARQARLAVFPEAFIGGYPKGMDFGARVGARSDEGRDWFARYYDSAVRIDGPHVARMCKTAKALSLAMVIGIIEQAQGTLYCTALFIAEDGRLVNTHRKLMPTAMERLIWGMGDGATTRVIDMAGARVGAAICWENYMPLYRSWLYAQGVEVYCAPTVDDRPQWQTSMRHIAYEGRCFVLSACQYATTADYPRDYPAGQGGDALIKGGSLIVSPFGEVLAGPLTGQEGILSAELELRQIVRGKFDLDVSGHYGRPDVFSLKVNTTAMLCVDTAM